MRRPERRLADADAPTGSVVTFCAHALRPVREFAGLGRTMHVLVVAVGQVEDAIPEVTERRTKVCPVRIRTALGGAEAASASGRRPR